MHLHTLMHMYGAYIHTHTPLYIIFGGLHCYHLCALAMVVIKIVKSLNFFSHHLNLFISHL